MLGPIDKRINEKATRLLEKGSRIEIHEPQEVIEKDYDKKRVEDITSCVMKQFPKIKSGLFSYLLSYSQCPCYTWAGEYSSIIKEQS